MVRVVKSYARVYREVTHLAVTVKSRLCSEVADVSNIEISVDLRWALCVRLASRYSHR